MLSLFTNGLNKQTPTKEFAAIPAKINKVPVVAYASKSFTIKSGIRIGPRPVKVTQSPIAMLRFFLKYVFNAKLVAG